MATHSSVLSWRIPGMGEPGGAAVSGVAQSQTRRKQLSSSTSRGNGQYTDSGVKQLTIKPAKKSRNLRGGRDWQ